MLVCQTCGEKQAVPKHCGQAMHLEAVDGREMLFCWMGAGCGSQAVPVHCDQPMRISEG